MSVRNIYSTICSFDTIITAEKECGANKRYETEVLRFRENYEENIYDIIHGLKDVTVPPTSYRYFYVYDPKVRKVIYIDYTSKIIQRAMYDVINPRISKGFIRDSYACITGRGQLKAMQRLKSWLEYAADSGNQWFYLKLDVKKFFYRIDHAIMCDIIEDKIGDSKTVQLMEHYICEAEIPFGLPLDASATDVPDSEMLWDVGIPLGGGLSHMEANMYMDVLDQECKRVLRIEYYIRYADDIIILSDSKAQLHEWKDYIEKFLNIRLHLTLNNKTAIRPISQGVEFVGYRIWPYYATLRKSTTLRMKRHLKHKAEEYRDYEVTMHEVSQTVASYKAMLKHCDCKELNEKIWEGFVLSHEGSKCQNGQEPEPIGTVGYLLEPVG